MGGRSSALAFPKGEGNFLRRVAAYAAPGFIGRRGWGGRCGAPMAAVPPELSFNTAVSFVTKTNWQNYGGESTMSYLVQMAGLTIQNFVSAATGIALAVALIRGFARASVKSIGDFWVDLTRTTLFVLLPLWIVLTLVYVFLGVPQTLGAYVDATTLEGGKQTLHGVRNDADIAMWCVIRQEQKSRRGFRVRLGLAETLLFIDRTRGGGRFQCQFGRLCPTALVVHKVIEHVSD